MKRILALVCAGALALSVTACGSAAASTSDGTESSAASQITSIQSTDETSTLVGQITAIDGTTVTVQLGELAQSGNAMDGQPGGDSQQPPEKPDGDSDRGGDGQQPPEKPDGDSAGDDSQQPPEKPDGDSAGGDSQQPPDMPGGGFGGSGFTAGSETVTLDLADVTVTLADGSTGSVADLAVDDILTIEVDAAEQIQSVTVTTPESGMGGPGEMGGQPGGFGGGSATVEQGTAANELTEDTSVSGETYTSTGDDENALRITGATVTLDGITVDKSAGASSSAETGDFYGMNAALLATDGAQVTITNAAITSSAQNGNGVFSYGEGTVVNISDSTITTTADNSGGIQTTGGGTTNASNLTVETSGNSSAAIRSDRGGGTVNVTGGSYTSNGYNSPAVYSTADITVSDADLTATNSEALVIEGENSITLTDCTVSGNMSDDKGSSSDINVHNIMIYQSMSGDAKDGTSNLSVTGGTITCNNGDMMYVTNTACTIDLTGVTLINLDDEGNLLTVTGNDASHGWGTAGANGGDVVMTVSDQTLEGAIVVDSISKLNLTLKDNSVLTGTINIVDNAEGGSAVSDNAVVTIEAGSTWNLTGDCTITSLTNLGTINFNGYTITLADGTVLSA